MCEITTAEGTEIVLHTPPGHVSESEPAHPSYSWLKKLDLPRICRAPPTAVRRWEVRIWKGQRQGTMEVLEFGSASDGVPGGRWPGMSP